MVHTSLLPAAIRCLAAGSISATNPAAHRVKPQPPPAAVDPTPGVPPKTASTFSVIISNIFALSHSPANLALIMNPISLRCRLESRMLPGLCFGMVVALILLKVILGISRQSHSDIIELLIQVALAACFFQWIVSGKSSLWTVMEVPGGMRMERDGTVLYEGPATGIRIVDEDQGVMTLRTSSGAAFQFPRRRVFHKMLSQIEEPQPDR